MIFNSPSFYLIFLPLCVAGFALLGRFGRSWAIGFLALMSFVFYAQWSRTYVLLLLGSILLNYFVATRIARTAGRERAQTAWLAGAITINLLALGYFKYLFPFLNFAASFRPGHWSFSAIILPLGISFFTFTQIAYLVDLKQGAAEPESLLSYLFFVTFFPHLIAGPILHHKSIMPQVRDERPYRLNADDVALGLTWFGMGMFKKVVFADHLAPLANALFSNVHQAGSRDAWLGVVTYALQLYFDFSGYSDMALGLARIFSIRFPFNFNSPFKAGSMIDFWQRWHMTLTQYIMSYVFTPLTMAIRRWRSARGLATSRRTYETAGGFVSMLAIPSLTTMFLAGVWHGAGLQFFGFGILHGFYLTVNHAWRIFVPEGSVWKRIVSGPQAVLLTFVCEVLALTLFRANSLADAFTLFGAMAGRHGLGDRVPLHALVQYAMILGIVWFLPNTQQILGQTGEAEPARWMRLSLPGWRPTPGWWLAGTVTCLIAMAYSTLANTFLYFQF